MSSHKTKEHETCKEQGDKEVLSSNAVSESLKTQNDEAEQKACRTEQEISEEELVEAAIRAGEEAAERDMKAEKEQKESQAAYEQEQEASEQNYQELQEELKAAKKSAQAAEDRLARLQADWENYRRRTANERLLERERAAEHVIEKLLPIVDDMERALDHAKAANTSAAADLNSADGELRAAELADKTDSFEQAESSQLASSLILGIEAIHAKILKLFLSEGVEPIRPKGEAFNPLEHQAVGRKDDASLYEDTVCDVYQCGYKMAKKVIRPAMVTVSFGGKTRPKEDEKPDES